ncbi:hypothetical protein I3842_06G018300 [Carya illinoinensis]|uniref:Chaperone protein dnaJ 15 n=1 Tax=Carya illinoinensis TaxID=32201 RepID=A0A922ET54_CARIL|nr:hypothetical protein I3842_06G018300 [Carya illinoinensis]
MRYCAFRGIPPIRKSKRRIGSLLSSIILTRMPPILRLLNFSRRLHILIASYLTLRRKGNMTVQGLRCFLSSLSIIYFFLGSNVATVAFMHALDADGMDMEIDLSNLGTVNTMFAALFSKLGVPIKTTISANVLEEALNGTVTVRPLPIGTAVSGKVEKQCAHFFGVTINEQQAEAGIVVRVTSSSQSKFKLLYFEQDANAGYGLALQEDSEKTGKVTSAGMYFLHFQVYRMDSTVNALAMAKDPEAAFFKRLEGLQPCEVSQLKAGTHIFAVYGDNFFKTASYTIEALCTKSFEDTTEKLKDIEAQILRKRNELRQFETEYRKALARFQEVTNRYNQEKLSVDELLKQRDNIHSSFSVARVANGSWSGSNLSNGSSSKITGEDSKAESPGEDGSSDGKDKSAKKKWFNKKFG